MTEIRSNDDSLGDNSPVQSDVTISERKQEPRNPESLVLEDSGIPHKLGYATKDVRRPSSEDISKPAGMEQRPLHLREWRAEQANKLAHFRNGFSRRISRLLGARTNPDAQFRHAIRDEAKRRDQVAEDFLRQGTVTVPVFGGASARYTILRPPVAEGKEKKNLPPVVFIPGIANDLASVAPFAQEIAHSGRTVLIIGQPESKMGHVTKEFAEAAEASSDFEPHVQFYEGAIRSLLSRADADATDMELWGFSAGAPMVSQMLQEHSSMSSQVSRVVLINPSASVALPKGKIWDPIMHGGILRDTLGFINGPRTIPDFLVTGRRKDTHMRQEAAEDTAQRDRTFQAVLKNLRVPYAGFDTMQVKDGTEILVVTCKQDDMTHARKRFTKWKHPANVRVLEMNGAHNAPMMQPEEFVKRIDEYHAKEMFPQGFAAEEAQMLLQRLNEAHGTTWSKMRDSMLDADIRDKLKSFATTASVWWKQCEKDAAHPGISSETLERYRVFHEQCKQLRHLPLPKNRTEKKELLVNIGQLYREFCRLKDQLHFEAMRWDLEHSPRNASSDRRSSTSRHERSGWFGDVLGNDPFGP